MKRILLYVMLFILVIVLASCIDQPSPHVYQLALIGDSTVYIEEGSRYVDQGITIDSEIKAPNEVSYMSNLDLNKVGTYYIKYMYHDQSITRTVVVTKGAKTIYNQMITELKNAESYTYNLELKISYRSNNQEVNTNYNESYDVYQDISRGETTKRTNNEGYTFIEYTQINHEKGIKERYSFDGYHYWYVENQYHENPYVANTKFALDYFSYATREKVEDEYVYTVYLKPGAYDAPFYEYINFIKYTALDHRSFTPLKIIVYSKNDHITKIVIDMSQVLMDHLSQPTSISDLSYVYTFEFSKINELESIIIPPEALEKKNNG